MQIADSPYGFDDGHIVSYTAEHGRLSVAYEFWNERRSLLLFDGYLALHDDASLGVTVGSAREARESDFLNRVLRLQFDEVPPDGSFRHYIFCDVDDNAIFQVIARDYHHQDYVSDPNDA